jgi:hypothetical protein
MFIKKGSGFSKQKAQLIPLASKSCLGIRKTQDQDFWKAEGVYSPSSSEMNQDPYHGCVSDSASSNIVYEFST